MSGKRRPGRPPAETPREPVSVYFLPEELGALDAARGKMDRSTAIRTAVEFWVAWQQQHREYDRRQAADPGPADPEG